MINKTDLGPLDIDPASVVPPVKVGRQRDGRICVCGHGAKCHGAIERQYFDTPLEDVPAGSMSCTAGRHRCECSQFFAVLETTDTRRFMSKTVGPGMEHALGRGLSNALTAGVPVVWREGLTCGKCQVETHGLLPVAIQVGPSGPRIARETAAYNYMLCASCRAELEIAPEPQGLIAVSAPDARM